MIIYAHEADPPLRELVLQRLVDWCGKPNGSLIASLFSRLECLVVPLRTANALLLADYDLFFRGDAVEVIEISREILDIAANLRAQYAFRSPDAIHLATAIHVGAECFLTADRALGRFPGLNVEILSP